MVKKGDVAAKFHTEGDDVCFFEWALNQGGQYLEKTLKPLKTLKACINDVQACYLIVYFYSTSFYFSYLYFTYPTYNPTQNSLKAWKIP